MSIQLWGSIFSGEVRAVRRPDRHDICPQRHCFDSAKGYRNHVQRQRDSVRQGATHMFDARLRKRYRTDANEPRQVRSPTVTNAYGETMALSEVGHP